MNLYRFGLLLILLFMNLGVRSEKVVYDRLDGMPCPVVGGGVQDDNGIMWFATWNGLYAYDGYEFHRVSIRPGEKSSIHSNLIRNIAKLPTGAILCRTDDGLYEFDCNTMSFRDVMGPIPDSLLRSINGVWHGTEIVQGSVGVEWSYAKEGIVKDYSPQYPSMVVPGSEGISPRTVMADSHGRLWVGSHGRPGVRVYDNGSVIDSMPVDFTPYSIFESSAGKVFIGGKPGGLERSDGKHISTDVVYDMVEDTEGRLWIATWGEGLKYMEEPEVENPEVRSLGVGNKIRKLLLTRRGNLVAASSEGLITVKPDSMKVGIVRRIPGDEGSLSSDAAIGLVQDSRGEIYVATENSGISRVSEESLFSGNPVFIHYNVANSSLDRDEIYGIGIENDTALIITGSDRMMILNPEAGKSESYCGSFWGKNVTFEEGSPARLPDGSWVFAASHGVLTLSPRSIDSRDYVPPLAVTVISINGGSDQLMFLPDGHLDLDSGSRNVSMRFAALDFVDNEFILYRYRVDGSPWTAYSPSRTLTLFNLSAGTHRVELQSTDRYGRRTDNTKTITIRVATFWYETWWAKVVFVLIALGLFGGLTWWVIYIRNVNRKHRELLSKYMELLERPISVETSATNPSVDESVVESVIESAVDSMEDEAFLKRVHKYIEDNISNPEANVDGMAEASAVSRSTLNRRLHSLMGVSAARLLLKARMARASAMLAEGNATMAEVAEACGYSDPHYFSRVYRKNNPL